MSLRNISLANRLSLLFVLVALIPLVASSVSAVYGGFRFGEQEVLNRQQSIASLGKSYIGQYFDKVLSDLKLTAEIAQRNPAQSAEALTSLCATSERYVDLAIATVQGDEIARVVNCKPLGASELVNRAEAEPFFRAIRGEVFVGNVVFNAINDPVANMSRSVGNDPASKIVILAQINLSDLWKTLSALEAGEGSYFYVVDRRGNLIGYKDLALVREGKSLASIPSVAPLLVQKEGVTSQRYTGLLNEEVFGTSVLIQGINWGMVLEQPVSKAFAIQTVLIQTYTGLILVVGIAAILIAFLLTRYIVTPIRELTLGAEAVSHGNLSFNIAITSHDEIGTLAKDFNIMTARLRDLVGSLEQRVVERTRELSQAQERSQTLLTELDEATRIAQLANYELEVTSQTLVLSDRFYELLGTSATLEGGYRLPLSYMAQKFIHPADASRVIEEVQGISTGANPDTGEINYRFLHTNGETHYFAIRYSVERDAQNRIVRLKGAAQDVTERQKAAEALRERDEDLNALLEYSPEAIGVVNTQTGLFENVNIGSEKLFGLKRDDLTKVGPAQMSPEFQPDGRPSLDAALEKIGEALAGGTPVFEWVHRNAAGREFPCEIRLVSLSGTRSHLVRFSVTDITQRKEAEALVAKRAAELEIVSRLATSIASITDPQEMLQSLADLVKSDFKLYHAHIYLLNEAGDALQLTAGAGEAGRQMVAEKRSIPLHHPHSLVARAARTKQGVIVNNVSQEADFLPNPLLPHTQSELAVPLLVGDKTLGVLDVQADRVNFFTGEDARIQTILAAQIAVALQNAQSLVQSEKARQDLATLTRRLTREGWDTFLDRSTDQRLGYLYSNERVARLADQTVESEFTNSPRTLAHAITMRGEEIGRVIAVDSEKEDPEVSAILESVSQVLGTHIDNLRLGEQTQQALGEAQQRTEELAVLNEMGRSLTTLREVEAIYHSVHQYTSRLMDTTHFFITTYDSITGTLSFPLVYSEQQRIELPSRSLGQGQTDYVIRNREPLLLSKDVSAQMEARGIKPLAFRGGQQIQSWLGVPFLYGGEVIGAIVVQSVTTPGLYKEFERDLLTAIASQAVIAIENARSFQETRQRAERESTINIIAQKIQGATSVQGAIQTAIEELGRALKAKRTVVKIAPKQDNGN